MEILGIRNYINKAIADWWLKFAIRIGKVRKTGYRPVVIALSRKMPRLMEWIVKNFLPDHPELPSLESIGEFELTTELSIPFRMAVNSDISHECYILLDDIIIHGSTIRNVVNDLELLSRSFHTFDCRCFISAIFVYRLPILESYFASLQDISDMELLDLKTMRQVIGVLSETLRENSLPLDMEFPIIRIANDNQSLGARVNEVYDHFASMPESIALPPYRDSWNGKSDTVTVSLRPDREEGFDFAKVRYFVSEYGSSFEVYMPYVLPDFLNESFSLEVFRNSLYIEMWESMTKPVVEFTKTNYKLFYSSTGTSLHRDISRSLVVWLNYLLSLSYFSEHKQMIVPASMIWHLDICVKDICLILGKECCDRVVGQIREVVRKGIAGEPKVPFVETITEYFAPESFARAYSLQKAILAASCTSVDEIMCGIFRYQNFSNPEYSHPQYKYERLYYGETYGSLVKACSPYFKGAETAYTINQWVDNAIDNGVVVPKYEECKSEEGYVRWRRFFHAGLNLPEPVEK